MHKRSPKKPLSEMERRIPKSEKYSHIAGKLDTGPTVNKVKYVTSREFAKRRDELFFRLSKNQLYELYNEYESDEHEQIGESDSDYHDFPRIVTYSEAAKPIYEKPYLILDVREAEEYSRTHLLQARGFPNTMLRRDQVPPELYNFRNKEETLIIVYCDDERISKEAATVLVNRGTNNIFLLTGGLNEFLPSYPAFVEGYVPDMSGAKSKLTRSNLNRMDEDSRRGGSSRGSCGAKSCASGPASGALSRATPTPRSSVSRRESENNDNYGGGGGGGGGGTARRRDDGPPVTSSNRLTARDRQTDNRSESGMSTATNMSVAESVISRVVSRKGRF